MTFNEFGLENPKTLLLLPGTACTWQINFHNVIDELEKRYHLICVNYDGFDGDPSVPFPDMITVTEKIENYIKENHNGKVDGAYGSSLGGSFVGLLVQRKNIHIDHGFIGSSDLDQGSPFVAKIMTKIIGGAIKGAAESEKKRKKLYKMLESYMGMDINDEVKGFMEQFTDSIAKLHPDTVANEFYSDYVTPLEDDINVPGTKVHIIYALKMGKKYEKRYLRHFRNPDIIRFDMQHEAWMVEKKWCGPVLDAIDKCMDMPVSEYNKKVKEDGDKMKANYKNWVPKGMVAGTIAGSAVLAGGTVAAYLYGDKIGPRFKKIATGVLGAGTLCCGAFAGWAVSAYSKFSYNGKRQMSKQIVEGTADYVTIPNGGIGLDVGCGSGALTIACAKRNPKARIIGIDRWGKEYKSFSKNLCEENALAEGVDNVEFCKGDACKLDYPDEYFDAVTSNYVYHNITGKNKQELLKETLRVLKKGGVFAIHDLMSKARYGDMQKFVNELYDMGFEKVRLIDTTDGMFMSKAEARRLMLTGSTLLVGIK